MVEKLIILQGSLHHISLKNTVKSKHVIDSLSYLFSRIIIVKSNHHVTVRELMVNLITFKVKRKILLF